MLQYNFRGNEDELHQGRGPLAVHSSGSRSQHEVAGELELAQAVLRHAIHEYQKFAGLRSRRARQWFREVDSWFSADDRRWHFSFINLCEILDLEPTYIRTGLKMWRERRMTQDA
jgi:hypothetical protein